MVRFVSCGMWQLDNIGHWTTVCANESDETGQLTDDVYGSNFSDGKHVSYYALVAVEPVGRHFLRNSTLR